MECAHHEGPGLVVLLQHPVVVQGADSTLLDSSEAPETQNHHESKRRRDPWRNLYLILLRGFFFDPCPQSPELSNLDHLTPDPSWQLTDPLLLNGWIYSPLSILHLSYNFMAGYSLLS